MRMRMRKRKRKRPALIEQLQRMSTQWLTRLIIGERMQGLLGGSWCGTELGPGCWKVPCVDEPHTKTEPFFLGVSRFHTRLALKSRENKSCNS